MALYRIDVNIDYRLLYFFISSSKTLNAVVTRLYRCADKSLARPGRKQATATEDFNFHISYL
jgi:hypothetical protein